MTIAGFTFTKVGFKSRMRGQCFGFTFGFTRKKFHGNVMALIELIGQKSRSE